MNGTSRHTDKQPDRNTQSRQPRVCLYVHIFNWVQNCKLVSGCKIVVVVVVYISDYICKRMHSRYCFSKQKHTTAVCNAPQTQILKKPFCPRHTTTLSFKRLCARVGISHDNLCYKRCLCWRYSQ